MPNDPKDKAAAAAEQSGFDLGGLAATTVETHPELKAGVLETGGEVAEQEVQKTDEQLAAEAEAASGTGAEPEPITEPVDDTAEKLEKEQAEREAEAAKKAQATKAANEEAAKKASAEKPPGSAERDSDLKADEDPHMRPRTRKVLEERNTKIIEARNRADQLAKEKLELENKLKEAAAVPASGEVPEAMKQEIEQLRQTVRELDISRDPAIKSKYDDRMDVNRKSVIDTLKEFGLGKNSEGKDDPAELNEITKAGVSLASVGGYLKKMEEAGFTNEAEEIRETLRENIRLTRDKKAEIATLTKDYDARRVIAQAQTAEQAKANSSAVSKAVQDELKVGIDEYNKQFPYMHDPEPPKDGDSEATVMAKNAAIAEFNAIKERVGAQLKSLNPDGLTPAEQIKANGRLAANAIQHVILKNYVFPRLLKDKATLEARVAELEADLGKVRKAGATSRQHAAAITAAPDKNAEVKNLPADPAEAMKAFAAGRGVAVDS